MDPIDNADTSLRSKTLHGVFWSFFDSAGTTGVQFLMGLILARLLLPEQFGLIGMLAVFMAMAQMFLDSGFGAALIRKQDVTRVETNSVFYFNIAVGLAAAALLCVAAPWIALFYEQPLLTPLCRVLSLNLVINSFGLIQTTLMVKRVDFKTQTKISMASLLLSGTLGITMAFNGMGAWSIVAQYLCNNLCRTTLLWFFNSWRPSLTFSWKALREMFGFGSRLLASSLMNTLFDNLYVVTIGKLFSAADVGFYTRAKTLNDVPSSTLTTMVYRVTFPVFSTVQHDPARLKRGVRKTMTSLVLVNFPMMIGIMVAAQPIVLILLTKKWAPSIPYLQVACLVGLMLPVHTLNLNVLAVMGRSDLYFRVELLKKMLVVANIALTCRYGILTILWGQVVCSLLDYLLNCYYTARLIDYSAWEQACDLLPYLATAGVMGAAAHAAARLPLAGNWSVLLCQIGVGVATYLVLCGAFRLPAFIDAVHIVRSKVTLPKCFL